MKITNETKIGALTTISILLLILGFNFLKGKDLFSHSKKIYAVFKNVEGLELSNSVINKGDGKEMIEDGDTLQTVDKGGILSEVQGRLSPVLKSLDKTLSSLDSLILQITQLFNPEVKNNFASIIRNLAKSSASLQIMLNDRTSALAHTMIHLDSFTNNLASNNQRITGTLDNLEKTTGKLANAQIDETLASAQNPMNSLRD